MAICEQVEDPKEAKGIVKREVIKVVTPSTNLNTQALDENKNNYLFSIYFHNKRYGISICDFSTGDYYITEVDSASFLIDEINKFMPSEIIVNDYFNVSGIDLTLVNENLELLCQHLKTDILMM